MPVTYTLAGHGIARVSLAMACAGGAAFAAAGPLACAPAGTGAFVSRAAAYEGKGVGAASSDGPVVVQTYALSGASPYGAAGPEAFAPSGLGAFRHAGPFGGSGFGACLSTAGGAYALAGFGLARSSLNFDAVGWGASVTGTTYAAAGFGTAYGPTVNHACGGIGSYASGPLPFVVAGYGAAGSVAPKYALSGFGAATAHQAFTCVARAAYRVALDADRRYELYVGTDGPPDLNAAPAVTGPALPLLTAPLLAGHTYHLITVRRNRWGLSTAPGAPVKITVAPQGITSKAPPSAPANVGIAQESATAVVSAEYLYASDGANAGDRFLVFVRTDGSDPNPATDAPTTHPVVRSDGVARLRHVVGGLADASVVKAVVRVHRPGPPPSTSPPSGVVVLTVDLARPPAPPRPSSLLGRVAGVTQH